MLIVGGKKESKIKTMHDASCEYLKYFNKKYSPNNPTIKKSKLIF
tara:strand:+ start:448 stop:582 length:135 start_codon:yes stop_codon:yes gene_type:complete